MSEGSHIMSRRTHKKSRNGCLDCKRRHIRCDETSPSCMNCRTAERICSFITQAQASSPAQQAPDAYPTPCVTAEHIDPPFVPQDHLSKIDQQYAINMDHMHLLCHFYTQTMRDFQSGSNTQEPFTIFQQHVLSAPYLLQQILAVAALHKSLLEPAQSDYYRNYASGLQTYALSLFNTTVRSIDKVNCAPAIIFCSMVGIHVLCDALRHRTDDLNDFLDRFTHSLQLHRGVWIVARSGWNLLRQTQLQSYLGIPGRIEGLANPGTECDVLRQMLREADASPKSADAYQEAVKHLQWAFDIDRCAPNRTESNQMLFAWATLVPSEYTDLLMQRRPEALIILAHFGVILFRHRDLWLVGDGAEFLIRAIAKFLGAYWERWLAWPIAESDRSSAVLIT